MRKVSWADLAKPDNLLKIDHIDSFASICCLGYQLEMGRHRCTPLSGDIGEKDARDRRQRLAIANSRGRAPLVVPRYREQKKPAWPNTLRYSITPAYSSTDHPARPGCPSDS